ncbi:Receptor-like cytosolic serine/threonine-protein kinase RBK2 [Thalictrum thalictroides]|uniref:Receptor-like cytosolic serine/threonine-protein kinase RBK2 n=1 Tax=Thalictrum thalictroides TaxID=46969 RepID=A0A7J6XHC5_THATH|nr:Receptor-like cytosolic serine/threonine-protein kinase RBK2 [Thalictrum thalictroides]
MVPLTPVKILVSISLDAELSNELLSWAVGLAARPNDTVVALHILAGKESSKNLRSSKHSKNRLRQAKAYVISMLGEFADICQSKQVKLEARVNSYSSIGRGLIDEAESIGASFLIVGGLRNPNQSQRSSLGIMKYCYKHAPDDCSVIVVGKSRQPQHHGDSEFSASEVSSQSSSSWSNKDAPINKATATVPKFILSKVKAEQSLRKKNTRCSPNKCTNEKHSPRAVLDGPEGGTYGIEEDYISLEASSITESPRVSKDKGHSNIWKHLSPIKRFFPFLRFSFDESRVRERNESFSDNENGKPHWRCFSFEEISTATNDFHQDNIVGRGGYAVVYRGDLYDGRTIAVKRLAKDNTDENKQKEFLMELGVLAHVCHPNTAHLIGCCFDNGLHLIFEFSPNGNLSSALHGKTSKLLEWSVRYKIILGIAKGLHYLHKCCKRRIIHRDIKASNVLLGPDFEPQITDFGLSKWLPKQWTHHSVIPIEGTFGYLAPEYFMHGIVDEKTDVYAFGVLLLEIITGRRPVDESMQGLMFWAKPLIESENIAELADSKLEDKYDLKQMRQIVLIASYCIRQSSEWRPSMNEVLQLLSNSYESDIEQSWRMPECMVDEMDDYAVDFDDRFRTNQNFQD